MSGALGGVRHLLVLVVFTLCVVRAPGQTPQECVAALRKFYAGAWTPSTSEVREWSLISASDDAGLKAYRALPGITESVHPTTLTPMFDKRVLQVTADGGGKLHIKVQTDRAWGPNRTGPNVVAVWGDQGWAKPGGNQPGLEANLVPTPALTCEQRLDSHRKGEEPFGRVRSEKSFVEVVRWIAETFECASGVREVSREGDVIELEAGGLGMFVSLVAGTGEITRLRTVSTSGFECEWWWEGTLQGVALPGKHPHFQFMKLTVPGAPGNETNRVRFDGPAEFLSFKRESRVDPSLFKWSVISDRAWDRIRNVVVRPDGTVDEDRTAARTGNRPKQLSYEDAKPVAMPEPAGTGGSGRGLWIGVGVATILASGALIWWRQFRRS